MAKTSKFDPADYLDSPQAIADYLSEAFETGDQALMPILDPAYDSQQIFKDRFRARLPDNCDKIDAGYAIPARSVKCRSF